MSGDNFDQDLANAGLDLLRAQAGLVVLDGSVPNGTVPPYVLVYTHIEWPGGGPGSALDGVAKSPVVSWYCHCVGGNGPAARAVAQVVRQALLNARPTVAGLSLGIITHEQAIPPTRDELTGSVVMDAVNVYRTRATTS